MLKILGAYREIPESGIGRGALTVKVQYAGLNSAGLPWPPEWVMYSVLNAQGQEEARQFEARQEAALRQHGDGATLGPP